MIFCRVVLGQDLQRLAHVDRPEHVGRAVRGQRQHAVVHGPQRHFAGGAAALAILDVDASPSRVLAGRYSSLFAATATVSRLVASSTPSCDVAEPEGRLARVARIVFLARGCRRAALARVPLTSSTDT